MSLHLHHAWVVVLLLAQTALVAPCLSEDLKITGNKPAALAADLPKDCVVCPMKLWGDRVFITVKLNGEASAECIIDSGAEISVLNKARVRVKDLKISGTQQRQGAFVGDLSTERATLATLKIGEKEYSQIAIDVINHGAGRKLEQIDMLLGMDFLSRTRFTLDFDRQRFIIWPFRTPLPKVADEMERERLPLRRPPGESSTLLPRIDALLNGKTRVNFLIDSGAGGPYFVATQPLKDLGLPTEGGDAGRMRIGAGASAVQAPILQIDVAKLELGKLVFENVPFKVIDASTGVGPVAKQDLLIGNNVLGTPVLKQVSAVHFDMPDRALYFERVKKPK